MLSGPEQLEWVKAFRQAFSVQEFTNLLFFRLDDRIDNYVGAGQPAPIIMGEVIDAYSMRDKEGSLIAKAIEQRPNNAALLRLARGLNAVAAPDDQHLERLIKKTNSFLDIGEWLERAGKLQVCVCRVEITNDSGAMSYGTGFLVGDDRVLTNYHVIEPVAARESADASYMGDRASPTAVICRFDFKVLTGGAVNPGTAVTLAQDWCVTSSKNNASQRAPTLEELDFAILRLSESVGSLPVGDKPNAPGNPRGFIALPAPGVKPVFKDHSPLFMIQHPRAKPLKLALDLDAILSVDASRTRVRYTTSSEPGSSGSPCFDQDWNLIALHHSGDPAYVATYNEGIPIDAIVDFLARHHVAAVSGGGGV